MNIKICSCVWLVTVWWCVAAAGSCDVTVGNYTYREETLLDRRWWIRSLAVDYSTGMVYLSYQNKRITYNGNLNLRSKVFSVIEELRGPCSYTVDQEREEVHAGCSTDGGAPGGLYQWDSNTGQFELTGEEGQNVEFVYYYNNTLYYSFYPKYLLHTFIQGRSALLLPTGSAMTSTDLVVDGRGDYIFQNHTGVYRRRGDGAGETRYEGFKSWVWWLAVDHRGTVYACDDTSTRGVWRLHDDGRTAARLLDVRCRALTFDADDNIIYANEYGRIVRLVRC